MSNYTNEKFGISTERRNYAKNTNELPVVDLLEIQKEGFEKFISEGFKNVFEEVYPVNSTKEKITVEYVSSKISLPSNPEKAIKEAKDKGSNYAATIKAKFRMINNLDGTVIDDEAFIVSLPLMTDGGSFIINGSERVIISQIVRAPGVYFENMKAARSQSSTDSSVFKLSTIIPSRGA